MNAGEREQLDNMGVKAVVSMPIFVNGVIGFYICLTENRKARVWTIDEIKFINDAIRILQSIITKRIQKNSLASSFQSLQAILDNVGSSIYVRDMKTNLLLFANRSLRNYFARELQEGVLEELFEGNVPAKSHSGMYEIHYEARDRWYDLYYTHINWVDGRLVSLCAIYDVTEKKLYQKRIEQQAYTDFLTGLYNRMCCERDLARYIDETQQKGTKGALLYLDLDDFKRINDSLGHQYGDVLLQNVASSLTSIAGIGDSCYRMGGDEFVVIVPPDSYYRIDNILNEIRNVFSTPWYLKDEDYYCTMSMGIVEFPDNGESVSELIKRSDIVMYEAKKGGKNRIARYSDSIGSSSDRRFSLEKGLKSGTYNNFSEFEVYYQPIIKVEGKKTECVGAEALLRWNSDRLGMVPPSEFIPLADYIGLIAPLGDFVIRRACENCRKWNKQSGRDMFVTINLTASQLMQTNILDMIKQNVEENNLKPSNLKLEITESLAINDLERTEKTMLALRNMGVGLVLDDFGDGYSSLNSIRVLPFEMIKISQKFVQNLEEDKYIQRFVHAVNIMAEAAGEELVVEGIETQAQFDILTEEKVKLIQGFYFDRALSESDFAGKYIKPAGTKSKKK
ncbi:MAG: EAL domain-containing protein [Butyrivibrio sp.]|nr:EAL domain-containing protein [Butyrivibrio sp.]